MNDENCIMLRYTVVVYCNIPITNTKRSTKHLIKWKALFTNFFIFQCFFLSGFFAISIYFSHHELEEFSLESAENSAEFAGAYSWKFTARLEICIQIEIYIE